MTDLASIRERHKDPWPGICDGCRLLAHIDALAGEVEGLIPFYLGDDETAQVVDRAAVLAIIRGEMPKPAKPPSNWVASTPDSQGKVAPVLIDLPDADKP